MCTMQPPGAHRCGYRVHSSAIATLHGHLPVAWLQGVMQTMCICRTGLCFTTLRSATSSLCRHLATQCGQVCKLMCACMQASACPDSRHCHLCDSSEWAQGSSQSPTTLTARQNGINVVANSWSPEIGPAGLSDKIRAPTVQHGHSCVSGAAECRRVHGWLGKRHHCPCISQCQGMLGEVPVSGISACARYMLYGTVFCKGPSGPVCASQHHSCSSLASSELRRPKEGVVNKKR